LSLAEIRKLVSLRKNTDNSCVSINMVMNKHIAQVEHRISQLKALRKELKTLSKSSSEDKAVNE